MEATDQTNLDFSRLSLDATSGSVAAFNFPYALAIAHKMPCHSCFSTSLRSNKVILPLFPFAAHQTSGSLSIWPSPQPCFMTLRCKGEGRDCQARIDP